MLRIEYKTLNASLLKHLFVFEVNFFFILTFKARTVGIKICVYPFQFRILALAID